MRKLQSNFLQYLSAQVAPALTARDQHNNDSCCFAWMLEAVVSYMLSFEACHNSAGACELC